MQSGYDLISLLMTQILPVRMEATLRHVTQPFVSDLNLLYIILFSPLPSLSLSFFFFFEIGAHVSQAGLYSEVP